MFRLASCAASLMLILVCPAHSQAEDIARAIGEANVEVVRFIKAGRYAEGLELALKTLERAEKELGQEHPDTLGTVNNLAGLYESQGRYVEAEPLHRRALEAYERLLGQEHPHTLISVNNLASLYESQGRYGYAEPLYRRALEARERVLGQEHSHTLTSLGNLSVLLTVMGKTREALQSLRTLDDRLAFWLNAETTSIQSAAIRRKILENNSAYQDAMYSFALAHPSEATQEFTADLTLRWKKRLAQDAAYLANLIRVSKDPRVVDAAKLVLQRQTALANAALDPSIPALEKEALKQSLEAAEAELRRQSEEYRRFRPAEGISQSVQAFYPMTVR
jgi:hypothetical protein